MREFCTSRDVRSLDGSDALKLNLKPVEGAAHSVSILVPGESDRPESAHFDDQARELFSKATAKPTYFGDRKELEKHVSAKKELVF